ncbi:MAG: flagellar biosynthesis protein FlhF [Treponema sp.]|jgi:flagellar biosynthesis protein FlhF|nr:flagellar biosynthesis protein FlhF [Treponema sp.]
MQQYPQYFIEKALTFEEAERKAHEKYGERLTILMHETVKIPRGPFPLNLFSREGVQITGIIPKGRGVQYRDVPAPTYPKDTTFPREPFPPLTAKTTVKDTEPPLYETAPRKELFSKETLGFAEAKEKVLAAAGASKESLAKDNAQKEILAEIRTIKEKLEGQGSSAPREEHPTLSRIDELLVLNDFSSSYRKGLLDRARKEFSLDGLDNYDAVQSKVLEWIGEGIKIYGNDEFNDKFKVRPRIMILVGPTGVGKTTTVVKLAVNFGINVGSNVKRRHKRKIVLVTIDAYRIKAKEQLEAYSEIMEFPCFSAFDYDELKKIIAVNSENTDLILIDTIGKSPRDMARLGEMKMLLDACGTLAEVHLAIAATTKPSDIEGILKTFEPFNYKSVIITKMDETMRIGNIIGALSEKAKPVSYITNGQEVPNDICKASVVQFLINLEGFKVNRVKLEEKFPDRGNELMR